MVISSVVQIISDLVESGLITRSVGGQVDIFSEAEVTSLHDDSLNISDYLAPILFVILRFSFQMSLGPYPWIYGNELYPLDLRSYLCGFSSSFEPFQV